MATRRPGVVHLNRADYDSVPALSLLALVAALVGVVFAIAGIPSIPLMHLLYRFGIVMPTCGLTRGVVAIAHGDLQLAWAYNPASFAVVLGWFSIILRAVIGRWRGRWFSIGLRSDVAVPAVSAVVLSLWIYQQAHADFVINS